LSGIVKPCGAKSLVEGKAFIELLRVIFVKRKLSLIHVGIMGLKGCGAFATGKVSGYRRVVRICWYLLLEFSFG